MRRTIIIALTVLALSVALCAAGTSAVNRAVAGAQELLEAATRSARLGDADAARDAMRRLGDHWERRGKVLELITSHDALFDAKSGIQDALTCLEQGDKQEFFRAGAGLEVQLERLRDSEALRWANLY